MYIATTDNYSSGSKTALLLNSNGDVSVHRGDFQIQGIDVITSSRNLTNIGTISSGAITCSTINTGQGATEVHLMNQNLQTTNSPTFSQGTFSGGVISSNGRVSTAERHPLGHYSHGDELFSIDPTWTTAQLREFFDDTNVDWYADSTAPDGYAIKITGAVNVGGLYDSGFPYLSAGDNGDIFYMECYIRNEDSNQTHYMGSQEFKEDFGQPSSGYGNPGSFGYWVMSNTNPGTSWTKVSGYIKNTGGSNTQGEFETGAQYWKVGTDNDICLLYTSPSPRDS